jgi:myo-inositol-1-phosphate synthase
LQYATEDGQYEHFHPVLSLLSVLLKAPMVPPGTPVGNAFMRQLNALTKLICACAGLVADTDLQLEFFTQNSSQVSVAPVKSTVENGGVKKLNGFKPESEITNGVH